MRLTLWARKEQAHGDPKALGIAQFPTGSFEKFPDSLDISMMVEANGHSCSALWVRGELLEMHFAFLIDDVQKDTGR